MTGADEQHDQRFALPGEVVGLLAVRIARVRVILFERTGEQGGKFAALLGVDRHEAPRRQLAMVGSARGKLEDGGKLGRVRAWADHVAGTARATGGEVMERAGEVVEHGVRRT